MRILSPLLIPLALSLVACSLTPELVKPALPIPKAYPAAAPGDLVAHTADLGWRSMFGDQRLQALIALALEHNRDLRLATLNVQALEAQYGIQRAARLPSLEASAGASRQRTSANRQTDPPVQASTQQQIELSVGLSAFEVDLFGRVHALSEAAFARYLASDHGRRAAQMALVSAVADAYFAERLADEQHSLAELTRADWQQSLALARRLKDARQNSALDVATAEGQVAAAQADVQARARALAQARHALQLLVGSELPAWLPPALPLEQQAIKMQLPAGLPSDLLLRRPDIQQAEQALVAANADIGAARAAFFPRLSLTAAFGYASPAIDLLFGSDQRTWSVVPQLTVPLFQGGRLRAERRLSEIRQSSAVAEYERAIQTAFREVSDGLAGRETYGRQIDAQTRAVTAAQRRAVLSALRQRAGLDTRLELLDAQRLLYASQQALLDLRRSEFGSAVALYKALGGGLVESDAGVVSSQ